MRAIATLGMALVAAASVVALVPLVLTGACSVEQECCGGCPEGRPASFELTCATTDLESVKVTGPCTGGGAGDYTIGNGEVFVWGYAGGACHVDLVFGSGFTYTADISFDTQPGGVCGGPQCACPDYGTTDAGPLAVHNPSTTCVEAGVDAALPACPTDASDGVSCAAASTCTGCREGAQFTCTCASVEEGTGDAGTDAGGAGAVWQCAETGLPCGRSGL
jgi:hypothetical protein